MNSNYFPPKTRPLITGSANQKPGFWREIAGKFISQSPIKCDYNIKELREQQFDSEHPVLFPVLDPRCDKCTNSCDFLLGPKNEMWFKQKSKTCQKFQNCVISFRTWWKKLALCLFYYPLHIHTQIILTFFAHFVELLLLSMTFRIFCKQRKQNP